MIRRVAAVAGLCLAAACGGGSSGDLATYCERYRELADDNPFLPLDVASPGEIETAFGDLVDAADAIADAAPDGLDRLAADYSAAAEEVRDLLDEAFYDPRNLDTTRYRRATITYEDAATALSKETSARCDG